VDRSTPIRKTSVWRRKAASPRRDWTLALRLAAIVPLLVCVYVVGEYSSSRHGSSLQAPAAHFTQLDQIVSAARQPAQDKSQRLVYQYSVVPGGVRDVAELSQAVAHDPDVALHYVSFNFRRAQLVRLPADRKMYISYRRHGRILWTKTPHLILAGEKVITDGKVIARTRCGNRLASKPEGLTAPDEPSEAQLNQPVAVKGDPVRPPTLMAQKSTLLPPLVAQGPPVGPVGIPIGIGPPVGGGGGGSVCETEAQEAAEHDHDTGELICPKKHHPPPPAVPEPATYLLMGSGVLFLAYQFHTRRVQQAHAD